MEYKVSFCIVVMNRLHHLKHTLELNLQHNSDYRNIEFILLDYNSSDGLEQWVKENLSGYIKEGKLIYFRTLLPNVFSHSHSKNLAFKLATGDVVCNINADHFTGPSFAKYVNEVFLNNKNIFLTPIPFDDYQFPSYLRKDVFGKICVSREDFLNVRGFDEMMVGYGYEDFDFMYRLENYGLKRIVVEDRAFLGFIEHNNSERSEVSVNVASIYLRYAGTYESEILYFFSNGRYIAGTLIDNKYRHTYNCIYSYKKLVHKRGFEHISWVRKEREWLEGEWLKYSSKSIEHYSLYGGKAMQLQLTEITKTPALVDISSNKVYMKIENQELINKCISFYHIYGNAEKMLRNLKKDSGKKNLEGFGRSDVFKNFDYEKKIEIR